MIIDHIWFFFFPEIIELRMIGRIAFPIFLFLIGFSGSYSFKWYILVGALLVSIPTGLYMEWNWIPWFKLNILWAILLTQQILSFIHRQSAKYMPYIALSSLILVCIQSYTDSILEYGSFPILFGLIGYLYRWYKPSYVVVRWYTLLLWIVYTLYMHSIFPFSFYQTSIVMIFFTMSTVLWCVLSYKNYSLSMPKIAGLVITRVSTYALRIYVVHSTVFATISLFI